MLATSIQVGGTRILFANTTGTFIENDAMTNPHTTFAGGTAYLTTAAVPAFKQRPDTTTPTLP